MKQRRSALSPVPIYDLRWLSSLGLTMSRNEAEDAMPHFIPGADSKLQAVVSTGFVHCGARAIYRESFIGWCRRLGEDDPWVEQGSTPSSSSMEGTGPVEAIKTSERGACE